MRLFIFLIALITISACTNTNNESKTEEKKDSVLLSSDTVKKDTTQTSVHAEEINSDENLDPSFYDNIYPVTIEDANLERTFDTLISKKYIKDNLFYNYSFNFTQLKAEPGKNTLLIYNDTIEIVIKKAKFDKNKNTIHYDHGEFIDEINGRQPWGIDGSEPDTVISSIEIIVNNEPVNFPDSLYSDLFKPNFDECVPVSDKDKFCYSNVWVAPWGEIIVMMQNSDGAGAYTVIWFIKPDKTIDRIVGNNF